MSKMEKLVETLNVFDKELYKNLENACDAISWATGEIYIDEGVAYNEDTKENDHHLWYTDAYLNKIITQSFLVVPFPEVQKFMEEKWFDKECRLYDDEDVKNAYFVPTFRIMNYLFENNKGSFDDLYDDDDDNDEEDY